jgi:hypothetical protein
MGGVRPYPDYARPRAVMRCSMSANSRRTRRRMSDGRYTPVVSTGRRNTLSQREKDGARPIRQRFRSGMGAVRNAVGILWRDLR